MKKNSIALLFAPPMMTVLSALGFADDSPRAIYSVPVDSRLSRYANFPLNHYSYSENANGIALHYEMPKSLVGVNQAGVTFRGSRTPGTNTVTLQGPAGVADCQGGVSNLDCNVRFDHLPIDSAGVRAENSANSSSDAEFQARQSVSAAFEHEPIGTIRYRR